jgi:purine-binding chemotaxis protein CheW
MVLLSGGPKKVSRAVQLVVFRLDEERYALSLARVERVVRAAEVTNLGNGPSMVLGVLNIGGHVLPVFNVRRRFGLPEREADPADHFLIAQSKTRRVVLIVDETESLIERSAAEITQAAQIGPGLDHIEGVVRLDDDLVLIHDLDKFLSLDEARALEDALNGVVHGV